MKGVRILDLILVLLVMAVIVYAATLGKDALRFLPGKASRELQQEIRGDLRYKGTTTSKYATEWNFYPDGVPIWATPYFRDMAYDRDITGILFDPHRDLILPTFKITVDGRIDLSGRIMYQSEELPDHSILFHWRCSVPEELYTNREHEVIGTVQRRKKKPVPAVEGRRTEMWEYERTGESQPVQMVTWFFFKPLDVPTINMAVYPWRELWLPEENQVKDPLKILVYMYPDIRPEWASALAEPEVWTLSGEGKPVSAEVDMQLSTVTLTLANPLFDTTVLELGPIEVEEGIILQGSYEIVKYGEEW